MRLHAEGIVGAPLEQTWHALLDVERLARAMPGVTLRQATPDGVRRGTLAVDGTAYLGSARLVEVDEDEHVAAFSMHGRELRGDRAVSATIRNRCTAHDGGTHVSVEAELHLTGHGDVPDGAATEAMDRFLTGLKRQVPAAGKADTGIGAVLASAPVRPARAVAVAVAVGVVVAAALGWRVVRRRRGVTRR